MGLSTDAYQQSLRHNNDGALYTTPETADMVVSSTPTYTNGLMTQLVEVNAGGKTRTTNWSYTNGLLSGTTISAWA